MSLKQFWPKTEFFDSVETTIVGKTIEPIASLLEARGNRYGPFTGQAEISQTLKKVMVNTPNWDNLDFDQKESLEMIVHKIARILNGDPNYDDSWIDIGGYSKLVADRLTA